MSTPGPMVDDIVTLFRYLPLAADGFALTMLSISACALAISPRRQTNLADRRVHDARLVDAELDLAGLDLLHGLGDVGRDGAGLRVRHQAARAEHLAEPADRAHHVRRRDDRVEIHPAAENLLDEFLAADFVGAGLLRLALLLAPAITSTRFDLPSPCGSTTVPRTI